MKILLIALLILCCQLTFAASCLEKAHAFKDFVFGRNIEAIDKVINDGIQNDDIQTFIFRYLQSKNPTVLGLPAEIMQDFILIDKSCLRTPIYLFEYTQAEYSYFYSYAETRFSEVDDASRISNVIVNQLEKIKGDYLKETLENLNDKEMIKRKYIMKMMETTVAIGAFERMFGNTIAAGLVFSNNLSDLVSFSQANDIKNILKEAYDEESLLKLLEMRDYLVRDQKVLLEFKSPEVDAISIQFQKVHSKISELEGIIGRI